MNKSFTLLFAVSFIGLAASAQNTSREVVTDKRVYLSFDEKDKVISFFTAKTGESGISPLDDKDRIALKNDNSCNLFFKWMNPFKYQLSFKDSAYVSPQDKVATDFFQSNYMALLGGASSQAKSSENNALPQSPGEVIGEKGNAKNTVLGATLITSNEAFHNEKLNLLALQYTRLRVPKKDAEAIKQLFALLREADDNANYDFQKSIKADAEKMINLKKFDQVEETAEDVMYNIDKHEQQTVAIDGKRTKLENFKFQISDPILTAYTNTVVSGYTTELKLVVEASKVLTGKLKEMVKVLENSVASLQDDKYKGYFLQRNIRFKDGNDMDSEISVNAYDYSFEKYELVKKGVAKTTKLTFERHDFVWISGGTGLFYADITLQGYGIADSGTGFTVVKDDVNNSTGGAAAYLNFNFDLGSHRWHPLLQFGADPTKKRPYLMFGAGFAFLRDKLAITYGRIFTWSPTLTKLTEGGPVASTTELEKDIAYKFDWKTQGWYLGLQYNIKL